MRRNLLKEAILSFGGSANIESIYNYMREREPKIEKEEIERMIERDPDYVKVGDKVLYLD
jgi:hypothetical protein